MRRGENCAEDLDKDAVCSFSYQVTKWHQLSDRLLCEFVRSNDIHQARASSHVACLDLLDLPSTIILNASTEIAGDSLCSIR